MRIWLVTVGEPLPLEGARDRLLRTGLLAEILAARGHEVLWWSSNVDHVHKRRFAAGEPRLASTIGASIQLLEGHLYRRNVSLGRIVNHVQIGRRFAELAAREPQPDVILCSFPTIELSREAVRYGRSRGVPVVLDVRDLWPDIFVGVLPRWLRAIERVLLHPWFRDTQAAFAACDGIYAVSDAYLRWGHDKAQRAQGLNDAVFPLGYQLSRWTGADAQALERRLPEAAARGALVTFVGSFGRTYDLGTVIDAAQAVNRQASGLATFVLCGAGEREAEWRAAAAGVPNVVFTGWLPGAELAVLLTRSALGLAAYTGGAPQGVPNKVIEYLAAGLPVLCSLEGESRELLEQSEAGTYFPAGDGVALASAVVTVLRDDALRARMAAAARELFAARFAAASVYAEMANRLEGLVKAPSGATRVTAIRADEEANAD